MKFFSAYLHGAFCASILYLCVSRPLGAAGAMSAIQVTLLIYWLVVAFLYGLACVAILRGWSSERKVRHIALGSLIPIVVLIIGSKLAV